MMWVRFALVAFLLLLALANVHAEWKPEYADAPDYLRKWFSEAELTPEAYARHGFRKCCDHADVVKTQFRVDRSTGADVWMYQDPATGEWRVIPDYIIHQEDFAPGGHPVLFSYLGLLTCFFKPNGGV